MRLLEMDDTSLSLATLSLSTLSMPLIVSEPEQEGDDDFYVEEQTPSNDEEPPSNDEEPPSNDVGPIPI